MKTYKLNAKVTISLETTVEAESLEKAIEIANDRSIEASNWDSSNNKEAWCSDEYDGEPYDICEQ